VNVRLGVCTLLMVLLCGSEAQAATFCVTSGNQLNTALETAEFNSEHDTIKVATGTHITDRYAPGDYQWKYEPALQAEDSDYEYNLTISGGWNAADNCLTQLTKNPAATVLDARYWGPVFSVTMVYADFIGTLNISNLTFYRGESNNILGEAGMRIIVGGTSNAKITFDNILVSGNRSGANFSSIAQISLSGGGILKIRNSEFLTNSFTHPSSGGLSFLATDGSEGFFTNNSISLNSATDDGKGLSTIGKVTLSNNAIGDNSSTANPSYDFKTSDPSELNLNRNHFQTLEITGGAPASQIDTTTGDPLWHLDVARMVPDALPAASPLRDSGDNAPNGGVPTIDFSGQPRIVNVTIDRGAVEAADAPPAVPVGPLVTAASPADGSTTLLEGITGTPGEFVSTEITFNYSGGIAPGVTKVECSITSPPGTFGMNYPGETVAVGDVVDPTIVVGFNLYSEPETGTVSCEITRDFAGTSYLTYTFIGVPLGAVSPAIFDSDPTKNPDPASTIELTAGYGALVGTDVFPKSLKLYNTADFGDSDMQISCGPSGGSDPQISITPAPLSGELVAPQGVLEVTFDCDTSAVGNFAANYLCTYDLDESTNPATTDGSAQYRVECDVRNPPKTDVEPTPPSGTTTSKEVERGGSASFDFIFQEVSPDPDPPADAFLQNCFIDGTDQGRFSIVSPSFPGGPYPIVNGAPQTVQVTGTDDGSKSLYTANLNCVYTDSDNPTVCEGVLAESQVKGPPSCGASAVFPLVLQVRPDARFSVTKEFTDDENGPANPTEVDVTISCHTGLPLIQTQAISQTRDVVFVVESFEPGELDCTITEDTSAPELAGYTPTYTAGGPGDHENDDGCSFQAVDIGTEFTCAIVNDADPVPVVIEKDWIIEGSGGDQVNQNFDLTLYCDAEIVGGEGGRDDPAKSGFKGCNKLPFFAAGNPGRPPNPYEWCLELQGNGDTAFTPEVVPEWPGSHCWVDEVVYDDAVEVDNGCGDINVSHGEGDSCLITNTVFFEGIPTLSQYGMAIMALLMLGVGLVGFRRL